MIGSDDLRESFGLGAVGFVTARADYRRVGKLRLHRGRIVGMFALRAVTGFTGDVCVATEFLLIDDLGVTGLADVMTGEGWSASRDLGNGVASIVSVLAKALGDDCGAQQDENCQEDDDDDRETDEMFSVLEHGCFPGPEPGKRSGTIRHCDLGYRGWPSADDEWDHRRA